MQVPYNIKILVGVLAPCTNVRSARNFNFPSTDLLAKIAKYLSTMKISTHVVVDCTKNGALCSIEKSWEWNNSGLYQVHICHVIDACKTFLPAWKIFTKSLFLSNSWLSPMLSTWTLNTENRKELAVSVKLISLVCCRLYCYMCTRKVAVQTPTKKDKSCSYVAPSKSCEYLPHNK